MGDAKRRREAEASDPLAAAALRLDEAARALGVETARRGADPGWFLSVILGHLVALLASIEPDADRNNIVQGLTASLEGLVADARASAEAGTRSRRGSGDALQ